MKIDYPHIFESDGFSEETGCGLTKGYIRFLLQTATQYHSFYDDEGARVALSDDESQLLEQGHGVLANLLINGCTMKGMRLVGDYELITPVQLHNVETVTITWSENYIDSDYLTFIPDDTFSSVTPGRYYMMAQVGMSQSQDYSNGAFTFDLRYNGQGGPDDVFAYSFWQDFAPHAQLHTVQHFAINRWFYFRLGVQSSGTCNISLPDCRVSIFYID